MQSEPLSLDFFKAISDNSTIGVTAWQLGEEKDVGGCKIVYVNQQASDDAHMDLTQALDKTIAEALPYLLESNFVETFEKMMKTGEPQDVFLDKAPPTVPEGHFHIYMALFSHDYIGVFFIDISSQVKLEESLEAKVKELEDIQQLMAQREIKVTQLKQELEELKNQAA